MTTAITLADIHAARRRIAGVAARTPLIPSPALSRVAGAQVYLKLENLQPTGAFKIRGAANKIARLVEESGTAGPVAGVTTFSTGNHGRAVAHVARRFGVRAVICVSRGVPAVKLQAIRDLGAAIDVSPTQDEAEARCRRLAEEQGLVLVHPFDDLDVIAGQGTIGLELLEDLPEVDAIVMPLSGGGLLSGVAVALKALRPGVRVIGVSMERAPVMYHSLRAGRPVTLPEEPTLADSLVGGIGLDNRYTFRLVRELADGVVLVSEEAIARAMAFMLREHGLLIEGGAATAVAALLEGKLEAAAGSSAAPRRIAVVVTGRNVDVGRALAAMEPYLEP